MPFSYEKDGAGPQRLFFYLFLDPNFFEKLGPIKLLLSVCQSVSLSVSQSVTAEFSVTTHRIFLIFCMKLGDHKGRKVPEPDFSEKNPIAPFMGKKGPKRAQNEVFETFMKIESLLLTGITLKWKIFWSSKCPRVS